MGDGVNKFCEDDHIISVAEVSHLLMQTNSEIGTSVECFLEPEVNGGVEEVGCCNTTLPDARSGGERVG